MKMEAFIKRMKEMPKIKKAYYLVLFAFFVSLIPLFYISRYNHMTYDDYAFGVFAHKAWQESHSILKVLQAASEYTKWVFHYWQGTYASVFLMSLQPGIYTEKLYFLTTFILIPALVIGIFVLVTSINKYIFKGEKYAARIIALFIATLCIQCVETPVDSFYWFNGSVHYTFFQSIVLLVIALEIAILFEKTDRKKKICFIAGLLSLITGGANYISSFSIVLMSFCVLFVGLVAKRKINFQLAGILGLQTVTLGINLLAPGNQYRASNFDVERNIYSTILKSFSKCFSDISAWIDFPFLILIVLITPIVLYMFKDTKFEFPCPGFLLVCTICLFAAMRFPTYYAMGNEGPDRASNIVQFMFYIYFVLDYCYVIGYVQAKLKNYKDRKGFKPYLKKPGRYMIVTALLFFFVVASDDYNEYTTLSAVASLYYNEAQLYHVECCEREKMLKDNSTDGQRVEVKLLHMKPKVLFHSDVTPCETDSANTALATYYDKASIVGVE